ncbi:MAG: hypothetical protein AABX32_06985 [Nanoarchaeota archaeon]
MISEMYVGHLQLRGLWGDANRLAACISDLDLATTSSRKDGGPRYDLGLLEQGLAQFKLLSPHVQDMLEGEIRPYVQHLEEVKARAQGPSPH